MKISVPPDFGAYFREADETTRDFWNEGGDLLGALRSLHAFIVEVLFADYSEIPSSLVLAAASYQEFLAAVRVAISGHPNATYPLLRVALEASCYSFLITEDPALGDLWMNRTRSPEALKAFRRQFDGAVRKAAVAIEKIQTGSGEVIAEAYDSLIDFGGHPNFYGISRNIRVSESSDQNRTEVSVVGLYGHLHPTSLQGVVACLDIGQMISIVFARTRSELTQDVADGLDHFNMLKEAAVSKLVHR